MRRARWLLVLLVVVLFVPGGLGLGWWWMNNEQKKRAVRTALREAGVKLNVDPDILDAIGKVESGWDLSARSTDPRDEERGGSYGPTQISTQTARDHGYAGDMDAFRRDASLAAEWTARIMRARPGGPPDSIEDAAAWWNAGRRSFAAVPEFDRQGNPHPTRTTYVPAALAALVYVQENPA